MKITGVEVVVEEVTMERLDQVYHYQELHQIILQLKILELLLDKTKKDFKIGKLGKEKENFQTYLKELLIR